MKKFKGYINKVLIMSASGILTIALAGQYTPAPFSLSPETILPKEAVVSSAGRNNYFVSRFQDGFHGILTELEEKAKRIDLSEESADKEPSVLTYNLISLYPGEDETGSVSPGSGDDTSGYPGDFLRQALEPVLLKLAPVLSRRAENSYGGRMFDYLQQKDAEWTSQIYRWLQTSPEQAAQRLGLGSGAVRGGYDPTNPDHDETKPETWLIPSWKNVNISFYDGDGRQIDIYSNAKEIASMASVYTYYEGWDDVENFQSYADALWKASHGFSVRLGKVYYCEGCTLPEEEKEEEKSKTVPETAAGPSSDLPAASPAKSASGNEKETAANQVNANNGAGTTVDNERAPADANSQSAPDLAGNGNGEAGITAGAGSAADGITAGSAEGAGGGTAAGDAQSAGGGAAAGNAQSAGGGAAAGNAENTGGGTASGNTDNAGSGAAAGNAGSAGGGTTAGSIEGADGGTAAGNLQSARAGTAGVPAEAASSGVGSSGESKAAIEPAEADLSAEGALDAGTGTPEPVKTVPTQSSTDAAANGLPESAPQPAVKDGTEGQETAAAGGQAGREAGEDNPDGQPDSFKPVELKLNDEGKFCPGHVDMTITARITGLSERNNLFKLDRRCNWTPYTKGYVNSMMGDDWKVLYGLDTMELAIGKPLTLTEIKTYMALMPPETSAERRAVVLYALNSVGKIPYYFGGKARSAGYENNSFSAPTKPDTKGRILSGLDCSGWVNWVYWSVTGNPPTALGTSGLARSGKGIRKSELRPGDILVKPGLNSHVVMFIGWAADGSMVCVHETGGVTNNVTVSNLNSEWPYYRSLLE